MNISTLFENQFVATKFMVPMISHALITRPRLTSLLQESFKHPLTLVSAPAGFGKTTLLAAWVQSLPPPNSPVAWISLDEEDNEPLQFWSNILAALEMQQPKRFTSLLKHLQSPQPPSLKYVLKLLINILADGRERFLLILDDYHLITEPQVHSTLTYFIEHLPAQLHMILLTRADPPLPLSLLRARGDIGEMRTDQLRCTPEETKAFFKQVMNIELPDEAIEAVTARTEGWLVSLQLLGLSSRGRVNPLTVLEEASGDQRYILDYLTEEVLRQQPEEVQTFLLSTCILERLSASLCDSLTQRTDSYRILLHLEQANLFVVPLDNKRQWYRYHVLFAQALRHQLEKTQSHLVANLHSRASLWYAKHNQTLRAVLHAFSAKEWEWAADLIEGTPSLMSYAWGASEHERARLREWLEQLPVEVIHARPRLCLACAQLLWAVAPASKLEVWLAAAQATLTASQPMQTSADACDPLVIAQARQKQEEQLGEVMATCAFLQSFQEDGQATLSLCQQALALLPAENFLARILVGWSQLMAYYASSANNAQAAIESGLQAVSFAKAAGQSALAIGIMSTTACYMIATGRLREAQRLVQQAIRLGSLSEGLLLAEIGWPTQFQAEILRERNQLDEALSLAEKALELCKHAESFPSLMHSLCGYTMLIRIHLSRGDLNAACSALRQFEHIGMNLSEHLFIHLHSFFVTVDQVKLWLACGELDHAASWVEELDLGMRHVTPFARERQEVARARIFLAQGKPLLALKRLEPALKRATTGQRWDHVIEMRLLQALAYQMCQEEMQALAVLSEALRLAEPEGYIRRFVDEGPSMAALLSKLGQEQRKAGPTPYLDTILAAFLPQSKAYEAQSKKVGQGVIARPLLDPLSQREQQVLQLVAKGASNLEIAQELVIVVDTVKRHVSQIFSKLDVQNRVQAVRKARELGLLGEEL